MPFICWQVQEYQGTVTFFKGCGLHKALRMLPMDTKDESHANAKSPADASFHDSPSAPADTSIESSREETPHVHEVVKDVDELIAAMDQVDEGMSEGDEEPEEDPVGKKKVEKIPTVEKSSESSEIRAAKERLAVVKSKLLTLQWDLEHGQINPAKKALFERLKPEHDSLVKMIGDSIPKGE